MVVPKLFDELWVTTNDTSLYVLFEILSRNVSGWQAKSC